MIITWIIYLLLIPLLAIRWLRWLAIVQQKEYRVDRLGSFLRSEEGVKELLRILPSWRDFTRTGLKRPVRTLRIALVAFVSALVMLVLTLVIGLISEPMLPLVLIAFYIFLPIILFFSGLPPVIVVYFLTLGALKKAQQKLQTGQVKVIGIGGSYGKTSTKHVLAHLLSKKYTVFVTPKSHNTRYSIAQSILRGYTGQQIALLEYGAYRKGEISEMTQWFPPDLAIETGFSVQHLSLFGSVENSLQAEAELVAALPLGEKVFCNAADEEAAKICEIGRVVNKAEVVPYTGLNSVISLENVKLNEQAKLSFGWRQRVITTQIVGKHYVPNIQAAIAISLQLGLSDEMIVDALESFQPNDSFVLSKVLPSGAVWIDDGATSNPSGFSAAIQLVRELPESQKILFTSGIVDLGTESASVHQRLAQEAKQVFQTVVYLGVDGHSQFEEAFGHQLISDKEQVLQLLQSARVGTVILVEGNVPPWLQEVLYPKK